MTRFVMLAVFLVVTTGEFANGDTSHFSLQNPSHYSYLIFSIDDITSRGPELKDDEFAEMLKLFQGEVWPATVTVVISGCYSGGFIDDIYAQLAPPFTVTTASTSTEWSHIVIPQSFPELHEIPYLLYWSQRVQSGMTGPLEAWAFAKANYKMDFPSNHLPYIKDSPEYASRGSGYDDVRWIGLNSLNKHVLLVAGESGQTGPSDDLRDKWHAWNELVRTYVVLLGLGFSDIKVYAMKDGLRPDGSSPIPIPVLGPATLENIQTGLNDLAADAEGLPIEPEFVIWIQSEGKWRLTESSPNSGGAQAYPQAGAGEFYVYRFDLDWDFLLNGPDATVQASGVEDVGGGVGGVGVLVNGRRIGTLEPGTGLTTLAVPELLYRVGSNYITLVVDQATAPTIEEVAAGSGAPNNGLTGGLPQIVSLNSSPQ